MKPGMFIAPLEESLEFLELELFELLPGERFKDRVVINWVGIHCRAFMD
jgi:hypothetical protein